MLHISRLITAVALGALAAPALAAQDLAELCRAASEPKIGQWASYHVSGGRTEGDMRLATVASERVGDSTFFWLEIRFTGKDPSHNGIAQILVPGVGARGASIRGLIMKAGNQPAMKMSSQMLGMMAPSVTQNNAALDWSKRCAAATVVGWESVTVPAGTLRALHVKSPEGDDAWVSRDIPFGLVKVHGKEDVVLTGRGSDAKSSIAEKPQEMPEMMMPKP